MRIAVVVLPALLIVACGQSAPDKAAEPSAPAPSAQLQPRVNMSPVDPAKAKAIMHERHEGMEKVGKAMKQLGRDMKARPLDLAAVKPNASAMNGLAQRAANWFPAGTGPDIGKTGAKPEIWRKPKDFAAKMEAFQKTAGAFDAAARASNAAAAQAAFADLGKSCKSCHELYRKKLN